MRMLVAFSLLLLAGNVFAGEPKSDILVTPDWLEEHLNDESLVIIQLADIELDYMRGHIPGARFLWPGWLEKSSPEMSVELFPVDQMVAVMERLGVSNTSQIVLCHTYTMLSAACTARTWVELDHLGMGSQTKISTAVSRSGTLGGNRSQRKFLNTHGGHSRRTLERTSSSIWTTQTHEGAMRRSRSSTCGGPRIIRDMPRA